MSDKMQVDLSEQEAGARILEMSYLLAEVAPIYTEEHRHACRAALGKDLAEVFPILCSDVGRMAMKNPRAALPYIRFIHEASAYALGRGPWPETADEPAKVAKRRVRKILKSMRLQELRPDG